jgi:integrase
LKYEKRFRVGKYYLSKRGPAWYRTWVDGRRVHRVSLHTSDYEQACQLLTDWFVREVSPRQDKPDIRLADVFTRYRAKHGDKLVSGKRIAWSHGLWLDFHGQEVSVTDALKIDRQEAFIEHLRDKYSPGTIKRTMTDARSALNRAWRRGELPSQPNVLMPKVGKPQPKGRPLSVDELARLYQTSNPSMREFIKWSLGTAARPDAILDLDYRQVQDGLINLLPDGREQTKKVRPIVRCPSFVACEGSEGPVVSFHGERVKSIRTAWRLARKRAGLDDKVQPYSLRHTCARWMRQQGVDAWQVATQLGHKLEGMSTTEIYTAYSPEYLREACAALEKLWEAVQAKCKTLPNVTIRNSWANCTRTVSSERRDSAENDGMADS